jgi:DNA-binding MarR family transcriptional regulator
MRQQQPKRHAVAEEMLKLAAAARSAFKPPARHPAGELHPRNLQVLVAIYHQPQATLEAIAVRLGLPRSSVSAAVDVLEQQLLITRNRITPDDGRRRSRRPTERGTQLVERMTDAYVASTSKQGAEKPAG